MDVSASESDQCISLSVFPCVDVREGHHKPWAGRWEGRGGVWCCAVQDRRSSQPLWSAVSGGSRQGSAGLQGEVRLRFCGSAIGQMPSCVWYVTLCVFRMEAPRYKRVRPANGEEPQRLVITEEVYISLIFQFRGFIILIFLRAEVQWETISRSEERREII